MIYCLNKDIWVCVKGRMVRLIRGTALTKDWNGDYSLIAGVYGERLYFDKIEVEGNSEYFIEVP